jgi:photosystem II stability/assembly factor-like uncharacterized protein
LFNTDFAGLESTLYEIAVDPTTPTTLYGSPGREISVVKSVDGGRTWSRADTGLPAFTFLRIVVDPTNPAIVYGGSTRGVFKSVDGGSTWSSVGRGMFYINSLAIDRSDPRRLYAASSNGPVFGTSDSGSTWRTLLDRGDSKIDVSLDPSDSSVVYAADYCCAKLWVSRNFGDDWTEIQAAPTEIEDLLIDPVNPATIYTGGSGGPTPGPVFPPPQGGVFRSRDGGRSWVAFNAGIEFQAIRRLASDSTGRFLVAVPSSADGTFLYEIQTADVPAVSGLTLLVFGILLAGAGVLRLSQRAC